MHRVSGAWKFAFLSDAIHMAREHRQNAIQYLYLHLLATNFVAILLTLTQKCHISQISNEQKARHLEQPSRRKTNWINPPCDPVQIIRTKDWHFKSLIIVNTATSYFFTNLHAIYVWNGHWERRFSHWYLQLHTRLAERYRWRYADLHSDWFHAVMTHSPFSVQFIEKILNRCKYSCINRHESDRLTG